MMKTWILAAGALALLGGCAGRPEPRRANMAEAPLVVLSGDALMYVSFDSNGDLAIDARELSAGIEREFARADANRDGALSPLEFQSWSTAAFGTLLAPPYRLDFDRNVDNSITAEEFAAEINARAGDYDKDDDGVLHRADFVRDMPRPQVMGPQGPPGGQMRRRPPG